MNIASVQVKKPKKIGKRAGLYIICVIIKHKTVNRFIRATADDARIGAEEGDMLK